MKIPCAINARDLAGVKAGTKENEIVSTLSIAVSSLVTILVLALGVLLLQPLQLPPPLPYPQKSKSLPHLQKSKPRRNSPLLPQMRKNSLRADSWTGSAE